MSEIHLKKPPPELEGEVFILETKFFIKNDWKKRYLMINGDLLCCYRDVKTKERGMVLWEILLKDTEIVETVHKLKSFTFNLTLLTRQQDLICACKSSDELDNWITNYPVVREYWIRKRAAYERKVSKTIAERNKLKISDAAPQDYSVTLHLTLCSRQELQLQMPCNATLSHCYSLIQLQHPNIFECECVFYAVSENGTVELISNERFLKHNLLNCFVIEPGYKVLVVHFTDQSFVGIAVKNDVLAKELVCDKAIEDMVRITGTQNSGIFYQKTLDEDPQHCADDDKIIYFLYDEHGKEQIPNGYISLRNKSTGCRRNTPAYFELQQEDYRRMLEAKSRGTRKEIDLARDELLNKRHKIACTQCHVFKPCVMHCNRVGEHAEKKSDHHLEITKAVQQEDIDGCNMKENALYSSDSNEDDDASSEVEQNVFYSGDSNANDASSEVEGNKSSDRNDGSVAELNETSLEFKSLQPCAVHTNEVEHSTGKDESALSAIKCRPTPLSLSRSPQCALCEGLLEKPLTVKTPQKLKTVIKESDVTYVCLSGFHLRKTRQCWQPVDGCVITSENATSDRRIDFAMEGGDVTCAWVLSSQPKWLVTHTAQVRIVRRDDAVVCDEVASSAVLTKPDQVITIAPDDSALLEGLRRMKAEVRVVTSQMLHSRSSVPLSEVAELRNTVDTVYGIFSPCSDYERQYLGDDCKTPYMGWLIRRNLCSAIKHLLSVGLTTDHFNLKSLFRRSAKISFWKVCKELTLFMNNNQFNMLIPLVESFDHHNDEEKLFRSFISELLNRNCCLDNRKLLVTWFSELPAVIALASRFYSEGSFWRQIDAAQHQITFKDILWICSQLNGLPFNLHQNFETTSLEAGTLPIFDGTVDKPTTKQPDAAVYMFE